MVSIKRQKNKGYILLEALIATSLFALIVGLVLTEIQASRKRQLAYLQRAEQYQMAKMAIQTGSEELQLNETSIRVVKDDRGLTVYYEGEVMIDVREN